MNFRKTIVTFALATLIIPAQHPAAEDNQIVLPDMGDSSGRLISPAQEQELGAAFFRNLHTQLEINKDNEIQQYIQSLGFSLASNSDAPSNHFYFFVVLDPAINAFAGPGGYIGMNSGLMLTTDSESELASVMAHEIAHVTQRHLYRAFEAASRLSLPTAAAMLAAILLGSQSPEMGLAALTAIQAGSVQAQINFTRGNEQEADRLGMQTLVHAGYNPRSMPVFFEKLQQSSRYYGQGIPEFLRTHPVTASRIADTRGRAEKYPYRQYPDSQHYRLTKAKLRVITAKNNDDVLKYFQSRKNQGTKKQRAAALYGIGLMRLKTRQYQVAEQIFKQLNQDFPNQIQYISALANTAEATRDFSRVLELYQLALRASPKNTALKIEYISTLLNAEQPEEARKNLQLLPYAIHQQPMYYKLLARSYGDQGQEAEAHRYMAEYYYANGQTRAAITQVRLAQKAKGLNFYLAAILDDRLNFFLNEEAERMRDQ